MSEGNEGVKMTKISVFTCITLLNIKQMQKYVFDLGKHSKKNN